MPLKFSNSIFVNKNLTNISKKKQACGFSTTQICTLNKRNPFTMSLCWISRRDLVW